MKWKSLNGPYTDRLEALRRLAPHELLGISNTASRIEVKAAFRQKARAYHPDRVDPFLRSHGQEFMKLLNQAYRSMLSGFRR